MILLLLLAGGGGYGYYLYQSRQQPIEIQVEKSTRRNLTELVIANGRIQPVIQVKISPEVSGEIIELPVKEGQFVRKGDLLMKIRPDYYAASKRSAEASFKAALAGKAQSSASLEKAEIEFRRNDKMFKEKLISESQFQEFQTTRNIQSAALEAATHQVDVAKASLARAEEDLAKTTIYSPIQGTVSRLNSQLGERVVGTAMMTGTEVMTVADLTEMEARVEVGEMDVVLMQLGLKARLEVDAFRDRKFQGLITEVGNSSRGSSGSSSSSGGGGGGGGNSQEATRFEVRIRVQEKDPFRPGMSVTAEIETRYRTNVLTIPIQSVTTRVATNTASVNLAPSASVEPKRESANRPAEVVFLLEGDAVKSVPVKRGVSDDTHVEILDGMTEGQDVVSGPYRAISRDLKEGSKVKRGTDSPKASAAKTPAGNP